MFSYGTTPFGGGFFFSVAPGESKFIPVRGNPRWSTKKNPLPFGGGFFFNPLYSAGPPKRKNIP